MWKFDKRDDTWDDYKKFMKPHVKRLAVSLWTKRKGKWDAFHAWTNVWVEGSRSGKSLERTGYQHGHVVMVIVSVLILTIIGLLVF